MRQKHGEDSTLVREQALRLLTVRNRSVQELRERLLSKGHSREAVEELLGRLIDTGLLDDRKYAEQRARAMGNGRGWGPRKLRADLIRRGIPGELVLEAVSQAYGELPTEEVIRKILCKRYGETLFSADADPKARSKAQRYLLGRGFEPNEVFALFR
jgi:regulatory protein